MDMYQAGCVHNCPYFMAEHFVEQRSLLMLSFRKKYYWKFDFNTFVDMSHMLQDKNMLFHVAEHLI